MRIALVTSLLWGGAARVLVNMANYWALAGHKVSLYTFEDGASPSIYSVDERVNVVFLDINECSKTFFESLKNNLRRLYIIRKALLADKPDVVISFIDTVNIRVIVALLGSRVPVIVSERIHPAHEEIGKLWKVLRRLTYPLADLLVVQTESIREYCRRWSAEPIAAIPNPVRVLESTGEAPMLVRPCVVAVGRMAKQKNYALLIQAFKELHEKFPEWSLYIVGKREKDKNIQSLLGSDWMADKVHFIGQIADVGGVLGQADIYAMTSLYEGFPSALCEAMAAGLPCVSTDCESGPSELIINGVNGILVENNNLDQVVVALEMLMSSSVKRVQLGRRAKEIQKTLSEESIMQLWDELMRKVVSSSVDD